MKTKEEKVEVEMNGVWCKYFYISNVFDWGKEKGSEKKKMTV